MRHGRIGIAAVAIAYFLVKACVNVFFITAQTTFFKQAGVSALPYVYTALNLLYMAVQGAFVQRLKTRSAPLLSALSWIFLALVAGRSLWPDAPGVVVSTAFLLAVMVYDLLFNQFFVHWLSEIYPLQESKTNVPFVMAFGSLAFIASGLSLKLGLAVVSVRIVLVSAAIAFLAGQLAFSIARRMHPEPRARRVDPISGGLAGSGSPDEERDAIPRLGSILVVLGFLTMSQKYWLDYQYSRAITTAFESELELASFIAFYTSCTDLVVLASQFGLAGATMRRFRMTALLALMPAAVLAGSLVAAASGSFAAVLSTQFLFTFLTKTFHTPASALLLQVLRSAQRRRVMSWGGIASSAGSMLVGLTLIAVQKDLSQAAALTLLAAMAAMALALVPPLGRAYGEELERALDDSSEPRQLEAMDAIGQLAPDVARAHLSSALASGDESTRLGAVRAAATLDAGNAALLLVPILESAEDEKLRAVAAKELARFPDPALRERLRALLADDQAPARLRAAIAQALASSGRDDRLEPILAGLLRHPNPRLCSAAGAGLARVSTQPELLRAGLTTLRSMLSRKETPGAGRHVAAVAALGQVAHDSIGPALAGRLRSHDDSMARVALDGLARLSPPVVARLLEPIDGSELHPAIASRVEEERSRAKALTRLDVSQLLDSLTTADRECVSRLCGPAAATRTRLPIRTMGLADDRLRSALLVEMDRAGDTGWSDLVEESIDEESTGNVLSESRLLEQMTIPRDAFVEDMERTLRALRAGDRADLGDRLLAQRARLLWLDFAALERLLLAASPGRPEDRLEGWRARAGSELAALHRVASGSAAEPARCLEALGRAGGSDPFAASLAIEYVQGALGRSVAALLTALAAAGRQTALFLSRCPELTGEDIRAWSEERALAHLARDSRNSEPRERVGGP